jgi:hypothetical protein
VSSEVDTIGRDATWWPRPFVAWERGWGLIDIPCTVAGLMDQMQAHLPTSSSYLNALQLRDRRHSGQSDHRRQPTYLDDQLKAWCPQF